MSWFLLAPALGAYAGRSSASIKQAALIALPALLVAVPSGVAIRGALEGYTPAAPFWVVSIVATSVLMTSWRVAFSQVCGHNSLWSTQLKSSIVLTRNHDRTDHTTLFATGPTRSCKIEHKWTQNNGQTNSLALFARLNHTYYHNLLCTKDESLERWLTSVNKT
jgi:hypothetical protein